MATSARKHTVPAAGEIPRRAAINLLADSINDFVPVANVTARAQLVADLAAQSPPYVPSTARPLVVHRADAPAHSRFEWTTNGTDWTPLGAGTGVIVPLGGAVAPGQAIGTGVESTVSVGTPTKNSGWSTSSNSVTVPEASLITASLMLNGSGDVNARHFARITAGTQVLTSTGYGDRYLNVAGQLLVAAGTVIQVVIYQASGQVRNYQGTLTLTARPVPMGW